MDHLSNSTEITHNTLVEFCRLNLKHLGLLRRGLFGKTCVFPTGSRLAGGYTEESDWDVVATVNNLSKARKALLNDGWTCAYSSYQCTTPFVALHRNLMGRDVNLILCTTFKYAKAHHAATLRCRSLGVKTKEERIAVFVEAGLHWNPGGKSLPAVISLGRIPHDDDA